MSEEPATPHTEPSFDRAELLPAIVQHFASGRVLMLGYMNREAYQKTLADGVVWFFSRSRNRLWMKGETSGNILALRSLAVDCDGDAILVRADPAGPTCHTGAESCFDGHVVRGDDRDESWGEAASELFATITRRLAERPEGSYIARLAAAGTPRMAQKVGEEATEVVVAAMKPDREELVREMADLWFHSHVLLADAGLSPADVWAELAKRRR
ncbi:MAG: bifunctional phosphoribosyl-AMP cyclohydrolase/phosphoribosyl-ATP diphosphatase HisIE [Chloroflexota bacterium]